MRCLDLAGDGKRKAGPAADHREVMMKAFSSSESLCKDTSSTYRGVLGVWRGGSGRTPWQFSAGAEQELIPQERVGTAGPLEAWPLGR